VVAQGIAAGLGQPVVVENRTGAAGNVATEHVARSAPTGHTLVVASMGSHATNAALYRDLPFDVARDFAPVSLVALSACLLVVHPSVPGAERRGTGRPRQGQPGALNCGIAGPAARSTSRRRCSSTGPACASPRSPTAAARRRWPTWCPGGST
jgi:tripartite-type tricarboxylate transporter receptor subunit TctC